MVENWKKGDVEGNIELVHTLLACVSFFVILKDENGQKQGWLVGQLMI